MKEYPSTEWQQFNHEIDGFDFTPGYKYLLKVNADRDGSSTKYTLLEQVSRTKV